MRILFCSRLPLTKMLGASKVRVEIAEALGAQGVDCTFAERDEILHPREPLARFPEALRSFLKDKASNYDVVEFDHEDLPFPRTDFPSRVLMVARSVLLVHHLQTIQIPVPPGMKHSFRRLILGRRDKERLDQRVAAATATIVAADLVNVSNRHDRLELFRRGISEEKIVLFPYGLSQTRRSQFEKLREEIPEGPPTVAFVGTFDYRKGALEIPVIWDRVTRTVPNARLRLLGTAGLMQTEREVRNCFSAKTNLSIEVLPHFAPEALPELLAGCWLGIFPSWYEGFGFGVLEMLAAALPVLAYSAPGPPEMLAPEYLCSPGDAITLAGRVVRLLRNPTGLQAARVAARRRSRDFDWARIAHGTAQAYRIALHGLRGAGD